MDGVKVPSVQTAHDKAITAINFQRDTITFRHVEQGGQWVPDENGWSDVDVATASKINDAFVVWAGGALILSPHDGSIIGAVGVSQPDRAGGPRAGLCETVRLERLTSHSQETPRRPSIRGRGGEASSQL